MAGASFEDRGGGSNTQCLPKDPEYSSDVGMAQNRAYIYGAEFDSNTRTSDLHDIPCALCFLANHSTTYMMPAKVKCPSGWTEEYRGYLMTSYRYENRRRKTNKGLILYPVQVKCSSLLCPPYSELKDLTCVVCSN